MRQERHKHRLGKSHTQSVMINKWDRSLCCEDSTLGARGPSPTKCSPTWRTYARKRSPHNIWLSKPVWITIERNKGQLEAEMMILKGWLANTLVLNSSTGAAAWEAPRTKLTSGQGLLWLGWRALSPGTEALAGAIVLLLSPPPTQLAWLRKVQTPLLSINLANTVFPALSGVSLRSQPT